MQPAGNRRRAGLDFQPQGENGMNWQHLIAGFFAGAFLANFVPHYVKGICGDRFPTPFAHPPGKGLSSPLVNVVWALLNLAFGCFLFRLGNVWSGNTPALLVFFAGVVALSVNMSIHFAKKHAD
jgi:hypothetical protein